MFHVEISAGFHRARVFNLNREDLIAKVVEPWLDDRRIEMGDREWVPAREQPADPRGAANGDDRPRLRPGLVERRAGLEERHPRAPLPAPPPATPDAFVIETETPEAVTAEVVGRPRRPTRSTGPTRASRIDGRDPEVAAVILVVRPED